MAIVMNVTREKKDEKGLEILFKNIDLIEQNKQKILNNPDLYGIYVAGAGVTGMYIGKTRLFLGDLIRLWDNQIWKNEGRYYYHVGGSPLSGMSFCDYWHPQEGFRLVKNNPSFGTLARPALKMLKDIPEECPFIEISKENKRSSQSKITIDDLIRLLNKKIN